MSGKASGSAGPPRSRRRATRSRSPSQTCPSRKARRARTGIWHEMKKEATRAVLEKHFSIDFLLSQKQRGCATPEPRLSRHVCVLPLSQCLASLLSAFLIAHSILHSALFSFQKNSLLKKNGRLAPARVAQADQPWGSIRRDGLPARLGAHWEGGL